jgi:predicted amidohydrolase YtcJ
MWKFILLLITISLFSCSTQKEKADLIIHNATVYTVDSLFTTCQAIAVKDGKIIGTGTNEEILNSFICENIMDANKNFIYPGFIDAHCHFYHYAAGLNEVNLVGTNSFEEVVSKVNEFAKVNAIKDGEWIVGRGWDQNDWAIKEYPERFILDSLFPNNPVLLTRIDGHAALANNAALQIAGITNETKLIGGEVLFAKKSTSNFKNNGLQIKIKDAQLSGILIDNAVDLVSKKIPKYSNEKLEAAILKAQTNCFAMGLTTLDDAGLLKEEIDLLEKLQNEKKLKMRLYVMLSDSTPNYEYYLDKGPYKTDLLNIRSFKFYADGALGSRGACLLEHYNDKPEWTGFLLNRKEHFEEKAKLLASRGFQMNTHCIGDSSDRIIANIYNDIASKQNNLRWRIEHAQVVSAQDLEKFKYIIPSVQPTHATSDMYWAEERLGKQRVKTAYAYKDLLQASGLVALGTDFPVEDISTFKTFYAAVARKDSKGFPEQGFQKENALTREQTLRGMTIWAAYSNFEEKEKGSIEKGKFADFVILDKDLMKCEEREILNAKVLFTIINSEVVFKN